MRKKIDLEKMVEWLKNHPYRVYDQLSLEILVTIADDYIEQAIIDHIYKKFTDLETELDIVSSMSAGLQMVYSTADLQARLFDDGFGEYFLNTPTRLVDMTLSSLKLIDAIEHFQLLQIAQRVDVQEKYNLPGMSSTASSATQTSPAHNSFRSLIECEAAFDALGDSLSKLRIDYIHKHPEEFVD